MHTDAEHICVIIFLYNYIKMESIPALAMLLLFRFLVPLLRSFAQRTAEFPSVKLDLVFIENAEDGTATAESAHGKYGVD